MIKFPFTDRIKKDFPASVVVFLVALPLCLGIAVASKVPVSSGILAGIIGGILIGSLSKSSLSVSGPAAGLTMIVINANENLGNINLFFTAVFLSGIFQLVFGILKMGVIGNFFPSSVIKGMLASIGLILILKQIPHALGYDKDPEGDEEFMQPDGQNTFTEIIRVMDDINWGAVIIALLSIIILIVWNKKYIKIPFLNIVPAPMVVVIIGTLLAYYFNYYPQLKIDSEHFVNLPVTQSFSELSNWFIFPNFNGLLNPDVYMTALTISVVASLETLLSIDAIDKLDPEKRISPQSQELVAQGIGNSVAGLIGALPMTAVIVRGSANVNAGAVSKFSSILHGCWLLISVLTIPIVLNYIPNSALAAILLITGYKLASPGLFKSAYKTGYSYFIPFVVTILAVLFSDLLKGILIGMFVGMIFVLKDSIRKSIIITSDGNNHLIRFIKDVNFFNKSYLRDFLRKLPDNSQVIIDQSRNIYIDNDIREVIEEFKISSHYRNIKVEITKSNK